MFFFNAETFCIILYPVGEQDHSFAQQSVLNNRHPYSPITYTLPSLFSTIQVCIEVLDVNDNAPQTTEPTYFANVLENSAADTPVVQITATDLDHGGRARYPQQQQQLRFQILKGNPQGFFSLNERTGMLTTTDRKLDRETQVGL